MGMIVDDTITRSQLGSMKRDSSCKSWPLLVLVLVCFFLTGCDNDAVYGDQATLEGAVTLDCSRECKTRGSCRPVAGSSDERVSVGAAPAFPGVSAVVFESLSAGTEVEILTTELVTGIEQGSNQEIEIRFYQVEDPESGTAGWVPGFCLVSPAP